MAFMRDVDTGGVFKHPVQCFRCDQAFYFTLRKIAEAKNLACPQCGSGINLTDEAYRFEVTTVKETIAGIDTASSARERTLQRRKRAPTKQEQTCAAGRRAGTDDRPGTVSSRRDDIHRQKAPLPALGVKTIRCERGLLRSHFSAIRECAPCVVRKSGRKVQG